MVQKYLLGYGYKTPWWRNAGALLRDPSPAEWRMEPGMQKLVLASLQQCDSATSCLPAKSFDYFDYSDMPYDGPGVPPDRSNANDPANLRKCHRSY